jgi:hypothetical protein
MYSEDKHIATRIDEIAASIAKSNAINPWELINKIYDDEVEPKTNSKSKYKKFNSYHNSLNLAFLLLNEESGFSKVFWKSYALTYQVSNNLFVDDLSVDDIKNIIVSLEKESKKNKSLELTLSKFKNFISQNGLLRTFSKTQIEFTPTLTQWKGFGALALLNDDEESLNPIIDHGKSIITKMIFNIYGLRVTSGLGTESYFHEKISNKDINFLIKNNLLKKASKKHKDRLEELTYIEFNNSFGWDTNNIWLKSEEFLSQVNFRGEIEDPIEGKIGFYGIFESVMKEAGVDEEFARGWGNTLESVISHSINTLVYLVQCRERCFDIKSDWHEGFVSEVDLAMVTGLSNPNSVKNAIKNGEMEAFPSLGSKKRFFGDAPTRNSALNWALDKKRKYIVHEPIDEKPERDIDYSFLSKEIMKAREAIEKSKKKSVIFNDSDMFARTDKKIFGRVSKYNKKRWEWIGKKGRTFKEINAKNSTYRKNIRRQTYKKHTSPITQDILYDLNSKYIKKIT